MNSPLAQQVVEDKKEGRCPSSRPSSLLLQVQDTAHEAEHGNNVVNSPTLGQRSVSLTTLPSPIVLRPRMAQLETLEAKMASIEVSLSNSPRRKKHLLGMMSNSNTNLMNVTTTPTNRITTALAKDVVLKELESLRCALRDKDNIIQNLKGQQQQQQSQQLVSPVSQMSDIDDGLTSSNTSAITYYKNNRNSNDGNALAEKELLTLVEKTQIEQRLSKLKIETDDRKTHIKHLKLELEKLTISDNIDVRIQQAEIEYKLGKEELHLLTLFEETRTLQVCLESTFKHSLLTEIQCLYEYLNDMMTMNCSIVLHAIQVNVDCKSPKFGVADRKDFSPGLLVDWAVEEIGIEKGDRLIEVNGKLVLNKSPEDLSRLLSADPNPAQIVLFRKYPNSTFSPRSTSCSFSEISTLRDELAIVRERAEEAQKAKTSLVFDNMRLTHRISYLEEQVAELLFKKRESRQHPSMVKTNENVTNINIGTQAARPTISANATTTTTTSNDNNYSGLGLNSRVDKELQIFQKGSHVTALVPSTTSSNGNNRGNSKEPHTFVPVRSKSSLSNVSNTYIPAPNALSDCYRTYRYKNRCSARQKHDSDNNNVMNVVPSTPPTTTTTTTTITSIDENFEKAAAMIVKDLTTRSTCRDDKFNRQSVKQYNCRKFENKTSLHKDRSSSSNLAMKRIDQLDDYTSEPLEEEPVESYHHHRHYNKTKAPPTPPKKPLRLSLHKSQSLQSMQVSAIHNIDSALIDIRKPTKRNYKGQSQTPPLAPNTILNAEGKKQKDYKKCYSTNNLNWSTLGFS